MWHRWLTDTNSIDNELVAQTAPSSEDENGHNLSTSQSIA
jgi:hypothetical protein